MIRFPLQIPYSGTPLYNTHVQPWSQALDTRLQGLQGSAEPRATEHKNEANPDNRGVIREREAPVEAELPRMTSLATKNALLPVFLTPFLSL